MSDEISARDHGDEHAEPPPMPWPFGHYAGCWFVVNPILLGLHREYVRDVNDGHDDVHGQWKLLYSDGSPATAEDLELVRGRFIPAKETD